MTVTKCDICKKTIKRDASISLGVGFGAYDICLDCGKPLIEFMSKNKLLNLKELSELEP